MSIVSNRKQIKVLLSISLMLLLMGIIQAQIQVPPTIDPSALISGSAIIPAGSNSSLATATLPTATPATASTQLPATTPTLSTLPTADLSLPSPASAPAPITAVAIDPATGDQIVETTVEETVDEASPTQPGKKVRRKRKRKVRRRVKSTKRKQGRGAARGMRGATPRSKPISQMTAQERVRHRSQLVAAQRRRRSKQLGTGKGRVRSNLQKAQAMALQRQVKHKKKGSRPTQGLTSKRVGAQDATPSTTDSSQTGASAGSTDDASVQAAPEDASAEQDTSSTGQDVPQG